MPGAVTAHIETAIGEMVAAATKTHLLLFEFERRNLFDQQMERVRRVVDGPLEPGHSPVFDQLRRELDEYFAGDRRQFTVPLHVPGTTFQEQVWGALLKIPHGSTTSYSAVAASIGKPDAVRAVARANGDNRVAILIPCHRVIGADGSLTGYGGGLSRKRKLLELEGRAATLPLFT
jgi:O-6-methylguanine DNA methyltransferase